MAADVVLVVAALAAAGTWTNLVGHGGSFLTPTGAARAAYQAGSLAMAAAFFLVPRALERARRALAVAVPLAMSATTALYAAVLSQAAPSAEAAQACCCLLGACYVWLVLTLYAELARRASMPAAVAAVTLAQVAEQLAAGGLGWLGHAAMAWTCAALPLASGVLTALAARRPCKQQRRISYTDAAEKYQVALIVAVALASVMMSRASSVGVWGSGSGSAQEPFLTVLLACAALALFSYLCLYRFIGQPLNIRYHPALLLLIAGFTAVTYLSPYVPFDRLPLSALDSALEFFGHVTMWVVAVDAMQRLRFHPYRVDGLMLLFGPFLGIVWPSDGSAASVGLMLLLAYAIMLAVSFVPFVSNYLGQRSQVRRAGPDADGMTAGLQGDPASTVQVLAASLHARCLVLAEEHGLTERELDVLELLAQGKTRALIQEELFISESTVKTHIKHVYTKFGVANVTELMLEVFEG